MLIYPLHLYCQPGLPSFLITYMQKGNKGCRAKLTDTLCRGLGGIKIFIISTYSLLHYPVVDKEGNRNVCAPLGLWQQYFPCYYVILQINFYNGLEYVFIVSFTENLLKLQGLFKLRKREVLGFCFLFFFLQNKPNSLITSQTEQDFGMRFIL